MAYSKTIWSDRIVQFPMRYKDQNNNQLTLTADPGTITQAGTPMTASRMNNIENGLSDVTKTAEDLQILFWMGVR